MVNNQPSKSEQIRKFLTAGWSTDAIVKKVGCKRGLISVVKYAVKHGSKSSKPRSHKAKPKVSKPTDVFSAIRAIDTERAKLRKALDRVRSVLEGVA